MADSVQVFKPGWRALDASGDPISGATLEFYDAGTSNARTVYSTNDVSTTSLGDTVTCDSGGFPTSDGNTKVEVYTGTGDYKIICKDSGGTTVWTLDNIRGATDTSSFLTSASLVATWPVTNTSSNQTPGLSDKGKFYNVNCSGGDVTFTLADVSTNGDAWVIKIRHDGTANQIIFGTSSGTDLFNLPNHAGVTDFAMAQQGQVFTITCDGSGYHVEESSPPFHGTVGRILIADRLASPPGSPQAGARYILTSSPSGAWSAQAEHDIAESDGSGSWFFYTPSSDEGLIAYVQDENVFYRFVGSAWQSEFATAAEVTTGTEAGKGVSPATAPGLLLGILSHRTASVNAAATGSWVTRPLDTEDYDRLGILSISSNQFTISQAGTYEIEYEGQFVGESSGRMSIRLYDVTGTAELDVGMAGRGGNVSGTSANSTVSQHLSGITVVTIAAANTFRIEGYVTDSSTDGDEFGGGHGDGTLDTQVTRVTIRRA